MTFMLSSDLPTPYCPQFTAGNGSQWTEKKLEATRKNVARKVRDKTKLVAWFVSNCQTESLRETYVRELAKFIQVDIYGKCGNLSCTKNRSDCDSMMERDYKFFLSFENSLCEDYVTEKLRRTLRTDVLPIVLGGANYTRFMAPGTYLDVTNFTSPRHLAEYLTYLDQNPEVYTEYLMRKRLMVQVKTSQTICSLCSYAHQYLRKSPRIIDLDEAWNPNKLCRTSDEFYNGVM